MNKFASLAGKSVIVTGSSGGIGRATAIAFAKNEGRVVLTDRREEELKKVRNECIEQGSMFDQIVYVKAELTTEDGVQSIVDKAVSAFGGIDVLVNNAGVSGITKVDDKTTETYDHIFDVNVRSVYRLTQLTIEHLKKSQGTVINISSINAFKPFPLAAAYNMSKAALNMFTESLALDFAPYNIRVNSVCPGAIKTCMPMRSVGIKEEMLSQYWQDMAPRHPLNRCGEADEVAGVITFLASDAAKFMTGAHISLDGGLRITSSFSSISLND